MRSMDEYVWVIEKHSDVSKVRPLVNKLRKDKRKTPEEVDKILTERKRGKLHND